MVGVLVCCVCFLCFVAWYKHGHDGVQSSRLQEVYPVNLKPVMSKLSEPIPEDLAGELLVFGSMRFPAPDEAHFLQASLQQLGIRLKIVDVDVGGDIDQEVCLTFIT